MMNVNPTCVKKFVLKRCYCVFFAVLGAQTCILSVDKCVLVFNLVTHV